MIIADIRVHPYHIPFRQPFATAHGTLAAREGAIVELVTDGGIVGLGEMAAVTEFGAPDVATLVAAAREAAAQIRGRSFFAPDWCATLSPLPPPLDFALERAHFDAFVREGITNGHRHDERLYPPVRVNATVSAPVVEQAVADARRAVTAGFQCIKLKVGMLGDPSLESERIWAVRAAIGPDSQLRLDANEAWTLEQAETILHQVREVDIQFVEQPLARTHLAGMRTLRQQTGIPIAVDEALTDPASLQRIWDADAADVLVLKPQLLGGINGIHHAVAQAMLRKKGIVITTTLEAGVGVAATLAIVQHPIFALPGMRPLVLACGLATLPLLEDDLINETLPVENGWIHGANTPFQLVTLDRAALDRYRLEVPER